MAPAIMNRNGVSHHLRKDSAGPRPRTDDLAAIARIQIVNLLQ
jgi:hypothetical protein